jgi:sulfide:quinone oxidoreductase
MNPVSHSIVIVGGGSAGITVAAQLLAQDPQLDIALIEPSDRHYYQPAWTLVGGGDYDITKTLAWEKNLIPPQVKWIQDAVTTFDPEQNSLSTKRGQQISYQYLVVCPGIQIDWDLIENLPKALGQKGVCSNYSYSTAPYTWETLRQFKGGTAIFTMPATPIKCGGAPQKIMYLADETFCKLGIREKTKILFCTALGSLFPVKEYAQSLAQVIQKKGIEVNFNHNLKALRPETREAVFTTTSANGDPQEVTIPYDMIHVVPPMSAPDFIKQSPLATPENPLGWVDVDKHKLQHTRYPNVFSLGDASSLPTSKTVAAIRKQAPVVVKNLLAFKASQELKNTYTGYTCCPLITGYGRLIMAEFTYANVPDSTFPIDSTQERWDMWMLKRYALPWIYWNRMLKGKDFEGNWLRALKGSTP